MASFKIPLIAALIIALGSIAYAQLPLTHAGKGKAGGGGGGSQSEPIPVIFGRF